MAYELVRPEGEKEKEKKSTVVGGARGLKEQDPRDRKDWETPPWARVGTAEWHKAWMGDSDSGYLDAFNALHTKMKNTRDRYEDQKRQLPLRKEAMMKEKSRTAWNVLKFGFVIPVVMWVLTQISLEIGAKSGFVAAMYLGLKFASFPIILTSVFFFLPPSVRDYVNCRFRYNVLTHPTRHSKYRDEHHIVSFAEEEHFLNHNLQQIKDFEKRVKAEKLDQPAAGEDYVFLDEMSDRQKEVLREIEGLAEFKDCVARPGQERISAGYGWLIVGLGILMGIIVLMVIVAEIHLTS